MSEGGLYMFLCLFRRKKANYTRDLTVIYSFKHLKALIYAWNVRMVRFYIIIQQLRV